MSNPHLHKIKYVYLVGVGGIGMSALARFFNSKGLTVSGYDKTRTALTGNLENEGIDISYEDNEDQLPAFLDDATIQKEVLVIYTPAIPLDHKGIQVLKNRGFDLFKRSEVLGMLTENHYTIAVGGTHGKTTTSSMVAHILRSSGVPCTAFLGGIATNYQTNLLLSPVDENVAMVVEADEFDRSFLKLNPDISVITSIDADHLDIYGNAESMVSAYSEFADKLKPGGVLIFKEGLPFNDHEDTIITYSINDHATVTASSIRIDNHTYKFDINHAGECYKNFTLTWPGRHNVENALAAFSVARCMGVEVEFIKRAIESFTGVKRRFEYKICDDKVIYIDDYAHHPSELEATISSVRELYPGERVLGIFQPHLFSRTRDFADGFARSLSMLDELILLDIYPAREKPIQGISSELIFNKVKLTDKKLGTLANITDLVTQSGAGVILTLGAGDIDTVTENIKNALINKYSIGI